MESSRFAKLPSELRISIYELALFVPRGIEFGFIKEPTRKEDWTLSVRPTKAHHLSPNLLATCKQINGEALPTLLSNKFNIPLDWGFLVKMAAPAGRALAAWGARYGPQGDLIKNLHLSYSDLAMGDLTNIATFARHALGTLARAGIRPTLTLSIDLVHNAISFESPYIVHLDLWRRSASENCHEIRRVARDALAMPNPWCRPTPEIHVSGDAMDDEQSRRCIKQEAEYLEGIVAYVQEDGVWVKDKKEWAVEEAEYKHSYEVEEHESEGIVDDEMWEAECEEDWASKGSRGRGSRASKKSKGSKGKGKKR